ncbi:hypothetical protein ACVW00_000150 [Marmoricola sp. URHA0025 HA25]
MLDLAIASDLAVRSTRRLAGSARPDAPVVPPSERIGRAARARARLATRLHRIAAALEPRREPVASRRIGTSPACR